jgi:Ca2+-binding RTX toxin-like protein
MPNTVYGTKGNDVIEFLAGVTNGDDLILADEGQDFVFGFGGDDIILGQQGNDTMFGGNDDDRLIGGSGSDHLNGGPGSDTADYYDSGSGVTVYLHTGIVAGGTAEGDTLASIENVDGSNHDDFLVGNGEANRLGGAGGDDNLKGGGGDDFIHGGSDNDILKGGGGADTLHGGMGINTAAYNESPAGVTVSLISDLAGGGDATGDELDAIQNLMGSGHDDTLIGDNGVNVLRGADGNDELKGWGGADTLLGEGGNDTLGGGEGHDTLDGGAGNDTMRGGLGNDSYVVNAAGDTVIESGGQGDDTVRTSVSWTLTAGADVETLRTTSDAGMSAINLTGNSSGNTVRGNGGSNVINGGDGNDSLTGLAGQDSFRFDTPLNAATNRDVITDFSVADDTIVLEDTIFGAFATGPLADDRFVLGTAARDANDNILYDSGTGALYYDSDGNGAAAAVQFAQVGAGLPLTHLDFVIV